MGACVVVEAAENVVVYAAAVHWMTCVFTTGQSNAAILGQANPIALCSSAPPPNSHQAASSSP